MRALLGLAAIALAACAPAGNAPRPEARATVASPGPLPELDGYASAVGAQPVPWTRRTLADDFIEITFDTEWGVRTDQLLRFPGDVRIALIGSELNGYLAYAEDLARRLDAATGPDHKVSLVNSPNAKPEIVFRTAPRNQMRRLAPGALCFLTPFRGDWRSYVAARANGGARWADTTELTAITIFIPQYATPYEIRVCLEEEATQALGAANDLYRLEDTIFNDDNAHIRFTAFDAVILRVLYDDAIRPGMNREAARAASLEALGRAVGSFGRERRFGHIVDDIHDELRELVWNASGPSQRRSRAAIATKRLREESLRDHRLAEALTIEAVLAVRDNEHARAIALLEEAEASLIAALPTNGVRLALTRGSLAVLYKREGRARDALTKLDLAIPVLAANAHDKRLAEALRWRAAARAQLGDVSSARRDAREALEWARYVFGRDSATVRKWRKQFADLKLL